MAIYGLRGMLKAQLAADLKASIEETIDKTETFTMDFDELEGSNEVYIDGDVDLNKVAQKLLEKGWTKPS